MVTAHHKRTGRKFRYLSLMSASNRRPRFRSAFDYAPRRFLILGDPESLRYILLHTNRDSPARALW